MGRIQDQNPGNPPQNYNNFDNPRNPPQSYNNFDNPQPVEEEVPPPSPYHVYSNIDEQIHKPSQSPAPYPTTSVNEPPYPPTPVYPQAPQTPPPAYPPPPVQFPPTPNMGGFQGNDSTPVQFPPTPSKGDFQDNNSTPVQFPPGPEHGQQYHQFQQQYQPQQMNNNFDGTQQSPYNNKPMPQQVPVANGIPVGPNSFNESWTTELFDCMDDPMNAITTLFFPCVTFGQIAEIIDNGQTSCATSGLIYGLVAAFIGMPCIMSCSYRTKLRNKYGLIETPAPDWITHFICEPCALCQAYRELQNRGLDPSIGWIGNVAKQQQQAGMMAAPTHQSMNG